MDSAVERATTDNIYLFSPLTGTAAFLLDETTVQSRLPDDFRQHIHHLVRATALTKGVVVVRGSKGTSCHIAPYTN